LPGLDRVHRFFGIVDVIGLFRTPLLEFLCDQGRLAVSGGWRIADHAVLWQELAIDVDAVISKLDRIARKANHALNVVDLIRNYVSRAIVLRVELVAGILKNDDVATLYVALRQKPQLVPARCENK